MAIALVYPKRPRAWSYMPGGFLPAWLRAHDPALSARWTAWRAPAQDVAAFARFCVPAQDARLLPPLFVHATAFRLQMAVLAHRRAPYPIFQVLQVRNRLVDHQAVPVDAPLDMACVLQARRPVPKGHELDLHTTIHVAGACVAESLNTFYVRGRSAAGGSVVDAPPPAPATVLADWRMPVSGSLRFGALTGDYNPLHLSGPYARLMGFKGSFLHPLHAVGQMLAHAGPVTSEPRRFDLWFKGPVLHGAPVQLRGDGGTLALFVGQDPRPAIIVSVTPAQAGRSPGFPPARE